MFPKEFYIFGRYGKFDFSLQTIVLISESLLSGSAQRDAWYNFILNERTEHLCIFIIIFVHARVWYHILRGVLMGPAGSTYSLGRELIIASDSLPCENNCTLMCIYERLSDITLSFGEQLLMKVISIDSCNSIILSFGKGLFAEFHFNLRFISFYIIESFL